MNPTPDLTAAGNGGSFDPQQAAALLNQTTQQTRRQTEPFPPWLVAIRALIALAVYGTIWLTVRGQHPYHWPTAAVVPVAVGLGIVNFVATVAVAKRATSGVSGKTKVRTADAVLWAVLWVGVFAVMGALIGAGVSDSVVYGIYPATVPLMAAGVAWAVIAAARANWRAVAGATAAAVIGAVAVFAGPAGCWAVVAVGLCAVLLVNAAAVAWRQRRSVVRP